MTISLERLLKVLDYDWETGVMTWARTFSNRAVAGRVAGSCDRRHGYWYIAVDGQRYKRSRLAFLYMTGRWPHQLVDHINHNPSDDRWENLREATRSQNVANSRHRSKLGVKGVWRQHRGYKAQICCNGQIIYLGAFPTLDAAARAYREAALHHHGQFACFEGVKLAS